MIGDHTLIAPLISEINIQEVEFCGVDQFFVLVSGVVVHLGVVQHLPVLPPNHAHGRVTAAGGNAAESDVVPPQDHGRLWVSCDVRLWKIICRGAETQNSKLSRKSIRDLLLHSFLSVRNHYGNGFVSGITKKKCVAFRCLYNGLDDQHHEDMIFGNK